MLILGTVAFDTITSPILKPTKVLGGSAVYSALAASNYCRASLKAIVGRDFGKKEENILLKANITTAGLIRSQELTFAWSGMYHKDINERTTIFTHLNSLRDFNPTLNTEEREQKTVFLANLDPVIQLQVINQLKNPKLIGLDSMNFWIEKKKKQLLKVIPKADVLFLSEAESFELTRQPSVPAAARKLLQLLGTKKTVVIKLGQHGVYMQQGKSICILPAIPITNVVDPTGAGDTFAGAFLGYLETSKNLSWNSHCKAAAHATACASVCVEALGTSSLQKLTKQKIQQRLSLLKQFSWF